MTLLKTLLAALLLCAAAARADNVQRLQITTAGDVKQPDAEAIVRTLVGEGQKHFVSIKLIKHESSSQLSIELRGAPLQADAVDRLRAMYPALRDAQITLVTAPAEGGFGLEADHGDLSDPKAVEALKRRIEEKLKAEGKTGTVDVQVDKDAEGKQRVRVEVKAHGE